MAEHRLSTFNQLYKLALAGRKYSAKQVSELAELVAAGLEEVQHTVISVTLTTANWQDGIQTIADDSLLADSRYFYFVGPDADAYHLYAACGVSADNVTTNGRIIFRCENVPETDLTVSIIRLEVETDEQ